MSQPFTVHFYGRFNAVNHGPHIQGSLKQKYLPQLANDKGITINFIDSRQHKPEIDNSGISHLLYPSDIDNAPSYRGVSFGPNIGACMKLGTTYPGVNAQIFSDHMLVADSEHAKRMYLECFDTVDEDLVRVIPIIVDDTFFSAEIIEPPRFTIGLVGYPGDLRGGLRNVKNLTATIELAKRHPDWIFELCVNRDPDNSQFFSDIESLGNIKVRNVPHHKMPEVISGWSCYLGISKSERGPGTIQECKATGCPTVCALHTGYAEFEPTLGLKLTPYEELNDDDIGLVSEALCEIESRYSYYLEKAQRERHAFHLTNSASATATKWIHFFSDVWTHANG